MGKFFSVTKKIEIAASKQHTAFGSGDVVADWQAIQIPKGSSCLKSLTMLVRPKGDAGPTVNTFPTEVLFSKTNTVSLGTVNAAVDHRPSNDFIGAISLDALSFIEDTAGVSTTIGVVGTDVGNPSAPLILEGDINTGTNVGFDKIYVGLVANGAFDFRSINAVNESNFAAGTQTVITMDGTSMDVREHFAAGDILHAEDDAVLGTVASADSATQITLTAANTDAIAEDDIIYNLNPIKLILGFER